jgi:AraC-like DNA-binding protein
MMPFLLAETAQQEKQLPLSVYCVGSHEQKYLMRPDGFPAHQLFLTRRGRGTFRLRGGEEFILGAGSALMIRANTEHEYFPDTSEDQWELGFVAFRGTAAETMVEQMGYGSPFVFEPINFAELWDKLEQLWHFISLHGEKGFWESSRRMYDMLLSVLEGGKPGESKYQPTIIAGGHSNAAIQAGVKLIHEHFNERLLLSNIANTAGYSVQHFHRLFVSHYGMTPLEYIHNLRMRRAVQLFADMPGITIERVAQQLGMETSYFIRIFKRTYGSTPKQYLKRE